MLTVERRKAKAVVPNLQCLGVTKCQCVFQYIIKIRFQNVIKL